MAISEDQRALQAAVAAWAQRARPLQAVRRAETEPAELHAGWAAFAGLGVLGIALPASVGGGGGSAIDLAVALEAAADALAPGPVLPTALAGLVLRDTEDCAPLLAALADGSTTAALGLADGLTVDVGGAVSGAVLACGSGALLAVARDSGGAERVVLVDDTGGVVPGTGADLSVPLAEVELTDVAARVLPVDAQRLRELVVTLAAAEAAGVARWAVRTAADYAKVREQFGGPIGGFQAVKLLCSDMLVRAEVAAAVAWDAAACVDDPDEHPVSAAAAGVLALDAAVANAEDCIQVLGGIGFTWEHDAHLYLRRALALRRLAGAPSRWTRRLARLTLDGARRTARVDLGDGVEERRQQLRAAAERIAATEEASRRAALADSGLLVPHWPAPHGLGAGAADQLLADEELARAGVVRPDLVIAGWALPTILAGGTPAQVERFVAPTLRGELVWCQLFSEPGAGSDLASLRTRADRVDGGWRLHGQKVWTSLAHEADWGVCLARTDPDAPKHKGITYFLVDMRAPGIDIRPLREITGDEMFNEVFLDGVFVPDDLVVGEVNGGWRLARTTLSHERVAMGGGSSIGDAVERLVDLARRGGLAEDPLTQHELGRHIADGLAGTVLDLRAVLRLLAGRGAGADAGVRKLIGVRHRQAVAEAALELAGDLLPGEHLHEFLLSRCLSIAGGTEQILQIMTAERVLGLPR